MPMRKIWIIGLLALVNYASAIRANDNPLTLGIFPYVSTGKLVEHQKSVLNHINQSTACNLSFVTAKNIPTYVENLAKNTYDLIYSAPHLARYVEKKYGYQRVVMTSHSVRGVFLVRKDSPYQSVSDLKNTTISMAPEKTLVHQIALQQMNNLGFIEGRDIDIDISNTHNSAIHDLLKGNIAAAVTGIKIWKDVDEKSKEKLRLLAYTDSASGFIVLAKPNFDKSMIGKLQKAFLSFNKTAAAKTYLFKGFKLIDNQAMESLDFHARVFDL
jgi:phosphonate transport system substrate-binding protein